MRGNVTQGGPSRNISSRLRRSSFNLYYPSFKAAALHEPDFHRFSPIRAVRVADSSQQIKLFQRAIK
jgi:hypothetical protein